MPKVATYSASGYFAGRVVKLRETSGPQRWRVVVAVTTDAGDDEEHVITLEERLDLIHVFDKVQESIVELTGTRLTSARMDFYTR